MSNDDKTVAVHVGGVWKQWRDEREHMIGEIIQLKKDLKNICVQYDEQNKLMEKIRQINSDLTEKSKQYLTINKQLENDKENLSTQLNDSLQTLEKLKRDHSELERNYEEQSMKFMELTYAHQDLSKLNTENTTKLDNAENEIIEIQNQNDQISIKNEQLKQQLNTAYNDIKTYKHVIEQKDDKIMGLLKDKNNLQSLIAKIRSSTPSRYPTSSPSNNKYITPKKEINTSINTSESYNNTSNSSKSLNFTFSSPSKTLCESYVVKQLDSMENTQLIRRLEKYENKVSEQEKIIKDLKNEKNDLINKFRIASSNERKYKNQLNEYNSLKINLSPDNVKNLNDLNKKYQYL